MSKNVTLKTAVIAIILTCVIVGTAVAAIMFTFTNTSTMHVVADYTIEVKIKATGELFDVYDWGNFELNELKELIVDIINLGTQDVYVSWQCSNLPVDWELTLYWKSVSTPWNSGSTQLIQKSDNAAVTIDLTCLTDVIGDYSFTLQFHSHDVA